MHEQILKYIPDYTASVISGAVNVEQSPDKWDENDLNAALEQKELPEGTNYVTRERLEKWDYEEALRRISARVEKAYEEKIERLRKETGIDYADVERQVLLRNVDRNWIDHIDAMDQLRKGIGLRAYGQKDPVIAYKQEGSAMFNEMIERIQTNTVAMLLKIRVEVRQRPVERVMPSIGQRRTDAPAPSDGRESANEPQQSMQSAGMPQNTSSQNALRGVETEGMQIPGAVDVDSLRTSGQSKFNPASMPKKKKIGPNDPCPCGSGLKYKKCHGKP